jgi:hypothetical protein
MSNLSNFCTCKDTECPLHPTNHDKGCAPCISKNLKLGEIPNCFFDKAGDSQNRTSYKFIDFAKLILGKDE